MRLRLNHAVIAGLLALFAASLMAGCTGGTVVVVATPPPPDAGFHTYRHPTGVFTLRLPPGWSVRDLSTGPTLYVEFSPPGALRPPLTVYVLNAGAPLNADAFERAISDYQAASHPQPAYQPQQRLVQADGSWLIPALLRTDTGHQQLNTFFQRERALFAVLEVRLPEDDETLLRQLDIAIDTFTLNADAELGAGQVAQAAAPLDPFGGGVVGFGGMYTWTDGSGGFHINGQVVNNDIAALEFVRLTAYLYDTAGNLLAEQSDYAASDVLMPGQYAPFNLRFVGGRPPAAARYEVHAAARHAGARVESYYGPSNFTIEDHADFNVHGHLIVSGTVTNSGPLPANYVKVTVTLLDGEGRVVATDTTFTQQQLLFPGQSTAFQLTFFELGGDATRYLTSAQAVRSE